jgi:formate dehydrogenase major subunit
MAISRREFFKTSGAGLAAGLLGFSLDPVVAKADEFSLRYAKETTTICPYCSVGCGMIVHTLGGNLVNVEGDPDHPISEGSLCPKGSSVLQLRDNKARVTKPLYRAPGAKEWKEVDWDWALDEIAKKVKKSTIKVKEKVGDREIEKTVEAVVNRTNGIAHVGSAALDNEECYLLQKFLRGLGLVAIEHQARI